MIVFADTLNLEIIAHMSTCLKYFLQVCWFLVSMCFLLKNFWENLEKQDLKINRWARCSPGSARPQLLTLLWVRIEWTGTQAAFGVSFEGPYWSHFLQKSNPPPIILAVLFWFLKTFSSRILSNAAISGWGCTWSHYLVRSNAQRAFEYKWSTDIGMVAVGTVRRKNEINEEEGGEPENFASLSMQPKGVWDGGKSIILFRYYVVFQLPCKIFCSSPFYHA